ncbi:MAG: hypothetical protein M1515_02875 [Candidatus Thermoplasmatota archaeon]|jgi:hypothetical protein|nr:hypothetical protein [Candidatus Thermoplasmatota archaeon]
MAKKIVGDVIFAAFLLTLLFAYLASSSSFYNSYSYFLLISLLSLEISSIFLSDNRTQTAVLPFFLFILSMSDLFPRLPPHWTLMMIALSLTLLPEKIIFKKGNVGAYFSIASLSASLSFLHVDPFVSAFLFLIVLLAIGVVSYLIDRNDDLFVSYLIVGVLLTEIVFIPQSAIGAIINLRFQNVLLFTILTILFISLILLMQDALSDRSFPLSGVLVFISDLGLSYLHIDYLFYFALVVSLTFVLTIVLKRYVLKKDINISTLGFALVYSIYFYERYNLVIITGFLMSFTIFYIIMKKMKLKE